MILEPPLQELTLASDDVVVIYGDEYDSVASQLAYLVRQVAEELDMQIDWGADYN